MCQSIVTVYQFCGCTGATFQQKCPEPSSTCEPLLARPSSIKLQCYCDKHSAKTFISRHKEERGSKRIDKEYQKILRRERDRASREDEPALLRGREEGIEPPKRDELVVRTRDEAEDYRRRKAEKEGGLRPGTNDKRDGICKVM